MDLAKIASQYGISVDEVRARWMILCVARWKADDRLFMKQAVRIRTKAGDLEPLILNDAQEILREAAEQQLREEKWVRLAGLKGRRQGFSTYVAARGYWRATLWDRQTYTFCRTKWRRRENCSIWSILCSKSIRSRQSSARITLRS